MKPTLSSPQAGPKDEALIAPAQAALPVCMSDVVAILTAPNGARATWRGSVYASVEELSRSLARCRNLASYQIVNTKTQTVLEQGVVAGALPGGRS